MLLSLTVKAKELFVPLSGATLDENIDSPFEWGVGGCLHRHPDGTFNMTPPQPRAAVPLKGGFSKEGQIHACLRLQMPGL